MFFAALGILSAHCKPAFVSHTPAFLKSKIILNLQGLTNPFVREDKLTFCFFNRKKLSNHFSRNWLAIAQLESSLEIREMLSMAFPLDYISIQNSSA